MASSISNPGTERSQCVSNSADSCSVRPHTSSLREAQGVTLFLQFAEPPTRTAVTWSGLNLQWMLNWVETSFRAHWAWQDSLLQCLGTLLDQTNSGILGFLRPHCPTWDTISLYHWAPFRQGHLSLRQVSKGLDFAPRAVSFSGSRLT